jgi:hypothetical protein
MGYGSLFCVLEIDRQHAGRLRRQIGIRDDTRASLSSGLQRASELRPLPTIAAHRLTCFSSIVGAAQPREWLSMTNRATRTQLAKAALQP